MWFPRVIRSPRVPAAVSAANVQSAESVAKAAVVVRDVAKEEEEENKVKV